MIKEKFVATHPQKGILQVCLSIGGGFLKFSDKTIVFKENVKNLKKPIEKK